jgi:excisionase family DNA binding protein
MDAHAACQYLGISRTALWKLMALGQLRWYAIEGMRGRKFKQEDLDQLIREGKRGER